MTMIAAGPLLGAPCGYVHPAEQSALFALSSDAELRQVSAEFAAALWDRRDVRQARRALDRARGTLAAGCRPGLLAAEAIAALFSGACDEALTLSRAVLAESAAPPVRVLALTALTGALTVSDRGPEAVGTARQLLAELDHVEVPAQCAGLAHALVAASETFVGAALRPPRSAGRSTRWPLCVGLRRHLRGDLLGALPPLRAAHRQEVNDAGLFRSEATAELIVVLAELGRRDEASRLLAEQPLDQIAVIPGLLPWAGAAVAAARDDPATAGELAARAARIAAARGAPAVALTFLVDGARWADPRRAAAALADLALPLSTALQRARAAEIVARGSGSASRLVEAAEIQLRMGFARHARELADLATDADHDCRYTARINVVGRQVGRRLGNADQTSRRGLPSAQRTGTDQLTPREREVARLAASGMTDRQIAADLVVSVRTVQTHLTATYRKLGIGSRTELTRPD